MTRQVAGRTDTTPPVGELAASSLSAVEVLARFGLDYCCDGGRTLADAAARAGADITRVVEELDARRAVEPPEARMETGALVGRIVEVFHARHRRDLPELLELAERVETIHSRHVHSPRGLTAALERLHTRLMPLMDREEQALFPAIRDGDGAAVVEHGRDTRGERRAIGGLLHEIEQRTSAFSPPESACQTWRTLYCKAARFDEALRHHTHLENNMLLPRAGLEPGHPSAPDSGEYQ